MLGLSNEKVLVIGIEHLEHIHNPLIPFFFQMSFKAFKDRSTPLDIEKVPKVGQTF